MTHEPMSRLGQCGQPEGSFCLWLTLFQQIGTGPERALTRPWLRPGGIGKRGLNVSRGCLHLRLNQ